jgi:hypothetical protein
VFAEVTGPAAGTALIFLIVWVGDPSAKSAIAQYPARPNVIVDDYFVARNGFRDQGEIDFAHLTLSSTKRERVHVAPGGQAGTAVGQPIARRHRPRVPVNAAEEGELVDFCHANGIEQTPLSSLARPVHEARARDEHAFPAVVAVQHLQHAAKYVDPPLIPERAPRENTWMQVHNFHTQPHDASGEKSEPRTACSDFERHAVTPLIRLGVVVLAFTDDYDVFTHLSAKWSAN